LLKTDAVFNTYKHTRSAVPTLYAVTLQLTTASSYAEFNHLPVIASAGASVAKAGRADGETEGVNRGSMAYATSVGKEA